MWGSALAPNLVVYAKAESAATFEAALRHGIGRDGRALYSMPSFNFTRLRDEDVAAIIGYLRSLAAVSRELPMGGLPWTIRLDMALGRDAAIPAFLDQVPELRHDDNPDSALARGEYLAMTTCNECHGFSLRADVPWDDESAPDLVIIRAYDEENFRRLMQKGIAIGERELELMSDVARSRFVWFTDQELADLFLFLQDMAEKAGSSQAFRPSPDSTVANSQH
jgi:mono/diheme cytochrome c family protein